MSKLRAIVRTATKRKAISYYRPLLPDGHRISDLSVIDHMESFFHVQDNKTKEKVRFRFDTVNGPLTHNILTYGDNPGYTRDGLPKWMLQVSGRQSTKSTGTTGMLLSLASRTPGAEAFILADTNDRSEYLYERAVEMYTSMPRRVRAPLASTGMRRQLRFDPKIGGKLGFYSAERRGGMVGFSGKIGQISEIPFMQDPGKALSVLLPALYHQSESRLVLESTPAPPSYNGAAYWKDMVLGAVSDGLDAERDSRFKVHFSPFWESKLNHLQWLPDWQADLEEIRLMEEFGPHGLTWSALAFRRSVMDTDVEIRRNHDLFDVWYPFSLTTCWGGGNVGLFPSAVMKKHVGAKSQERHTLEPISKTDRIIIGVDPAGLLGGADHAAFSVISCNRVDYRLLEVFSSSVTVHEMCDELFARAKYYRGITGKWPDIAIESNGVGAATLAIMQARGYEKIYHEKNYKPGVTASAKGNARLVADTCDALLDKFTPLWSMPLVMQLQSYSGDRDKRTGEVSMLINGLAKGRRERTHWDLASSFQVACHVASKVNLPMPTSRVASPHNGGVTAAQLLPGVKW